MRRSLLPSVLVLGLAVGLLVSLTPQIASASGDYGDGSPVCNYGEICLFKNSSDTDYTKHFWWSATRYYDDQGYAYQWYYVPGEYYTGYVANATSKVRNRDSACWVRFYDAQSWSGDYWEKANDGIYTNVPAWIDNDIQSHVRFYN